MAKPVLVVVSRDWFECVKKNLDKVDVMQGPKARAAPGRRGLVIEPGSVVIIVAKKPRESRRDWSVVGEFIADKVGYISREEYENLKKSGRVCEPPTPDFSLGNKLPVTWFKKLIVYPKEVKLSELCDVKTAHSKKPICEWIITGATVIDDKAVEGIREKVKPPSDLTKKVNELEVRLAKIESLLGLKDFNELPLTHDCVERILLELGRALGFKTYTADPSKKCGEVELKEFTNLTQNELPQIKGLKEIDVIWYGFNTYYLFEVVLTTDIEKSLLRFTKAATLNARYYIISSEENRKSFEKYIAEDIFSHIRNKTYFLNLNELLKNYYITKLWRTSIETFKPPYLST